MRCSGSSGGRRGKISAATSSMSSGTGAMVWRTQAAARVRVGIDREEGERSGTQTDPARFLQPGPVHPIILQCTRATLVKSRGEVPHPPPAASDISGSGAMLQLRKRILSHILPPSPTATTIPPILSLRRLLSATPTPFAAEDYLVANCGLSGAQALKASKKISHLKSSSKPDAVLDFLAGLGLSRAEVATVVTKDPLFLCADVQKTLVPRVVGLTGLGMSRAEIARLVLTVQVRFRVAPLHRNLDFWISVFGSFDELLQVLKVNSGFLCLDLEKVAKPNVEFLQQCGISLSDVPHRFLSRMVCRSRDHLQEALARVYEFGIEQSSWAFIHGFARFAILGREKLNKNIQVFEKLGWSRDDISSAVRRAPGILCLTEERVKRGLEFLMGDVMLDIPYIAQRPVLMLFSLERRLLPRHLMINFLESRELLRTQLSFYSIALIGEEKFLETFVHPYEDSVPGLAAAYASSCAGKHQWELLCGSTPGEGKG
jgi:mTERF domain-containing protein, mitochondrial